MHVLRFAYLYSSTILMRGRGVDDSGFLLRTEDFFFPIAVCFHKQYKLCFKNYYFQFGLCIACAFYVYYVCTGMIHGSVSRKAR